MYRITIIFVLSLSGLSLTTSNAAEPGSPVLGRSEGKVAHVEAALESLKSFDGSSDFAEYRLGPGDVVVVAADSVPEISLQYTVSETGAIIFRTLLAPLKVQGLTVGQLQNLLEERLTEYMHEPKVMVDIAEHHSHKVLVLGPFQVPGKYELKRERVPLLDIILEAGGLRELRENDELIILRNPVIPKAGGRESPNAGKPAVEPGITDHRSRIRIDLQGLLRDGDLTQNVMIQAGDVIYLTSFFAGEQYVYVAGGGRRGAGAIPYEPGLTAFKALLRAGVVPDNPQVLELIIVRGQTSGTGSPARENKEQIITTQLRFDPAHPGVGDVTLLPEDIVILPEASSQVIYVAGEVNKPGALPYREGLTILQAVLDAGGMSKGAVGSKVRVLREDAVGRKEITVDMNVVLEKGDKAQNIALMLGDIVVVPGMSFREDIMVTGKVNIPGMVPYEEGMTVVKAVLLAGGLNGNSIKSQIRTMGRNGDIQPLFSIDISKAQPGESANSNPVLEPGDLVVVLGPTPGNIISVLGKVQRPGLIEYEDGLTALRAVLRSGGFARGAACSKVRVVRGEGEQQQKLRANLENLLDNGDRSGDIALLPGDIVIVPETFF